MLEEGELERDTPEEEALTAEVPVLLLLLTPAERLTEGAAAAERTAVLAEREAVAIRAAEEGLAVSLSPDAAEPAVRTTRPTPALGLAVKPLPLPVRVA